MRIRRLSHVVAFAIVFIGSSAGCNADNQAAGTSQGVGIDSSCAQSISPLPLDLQAAGLTDAFVDDSEVVCAGAQATVLGRTEESLQFVVPTNSILISNEFSATELGESQFPALTTAFLIDVSQSSDTSNPPAYEYPYVQFSVFKDSECDLETSIERGGREGTILQQVDSIFGPANEVLMNLQTLGAVYAEPKIKVAGSPVYSLTYWCPTVATTLTLKLVSSSALGEQHLRSLLKAVRNEAGTSDLLKSRLQCKNWARYEGLEKFSEAPNGEASCFNWCVAQDWSRNKWWRQQFRDRQGQGETLGFEMYEGGFTQFVDEFCGELAMGTE